MTETFTKVPTTSTAQLADPKEELPITAQGPVHFYDAADPAAVPSNVFAAVYVNGFAWSQDEINRMFAVVRVSVRQEAFWAKYARIIDVENGAALPTDVVPFIRERLALGHHDATAYVNRSNWGTVRALVQEAGLNCRYWVATLDGTTNVGGGAWAVQYQGGMTAAYDKSLLLGVNDFGRVHH